MPNNGPEKQHRLDGWKSIARHFGRTTRTIQRWHSEYGLPIHRIGGYKSPIFAFAGELDEWMRNRGRAFTNEADEVPKPAQLATPVALDESDHRKRNLDGRLFSAVPKARASELVALANKMWGAVSERTLNRIAHLYSEAMNLDPRNADAFAGLSAALFSEGLMGCVRASAAYSTAKAALQRAVEINPELLDAIRAGAWLKLLSTRDWQGARRGFEETLHRQPGNPRGMVGMAMLHIAEGRPKEASGLLRKVVDSNPLNMAITSLSCWSDYLAGNYLDALIQIEEARARGHFGLVFDATEALASILLNGPGAQIERIEALCMESPASQVLRGVLGCACGMAGQSKRANEILESIASTKAHKKIHEPYALALVHIGLNQRQEAVKQLERCYAEGSLWSVGFPCDPILAPLRDDPHFRLFLSKCRYPCQ
jgi:tetratricopeptide (TPR) repeat protein